MLVKYSIIILVLALFAFISVATKRLTIAAGITGWLMAVIIYAGAGNVGLIMLAAFFILGSAATSHKLKIKQQLHLAETNKGRRTTGQVIANAGVATLSALLALLLPSQAHLFQLLLAASYAAATADTLSSEIGNVYGSRFYNILTFKKDVRGLDGVISMEGTLAGIAGSGVIAMLYAINSHNILHAFFIVIAGTAGNLFDSFLGANLERRNKLTNNQVNFLNTLAGAIAAWLLFCFSN